MEAVYWGRVECVRELVAVEGVQLETRDHKGMSLEEVARERGRLAVWNVLREEKMIREEKQKRQEEQRSRSRTEEI